MSDKLVSVIIPVYNVEKFVEQAIVSIIKQTYKHLEIIVIDDGSSDNTYKIVADLATQDPRIKPYKNEQNLKIVKTLNRALSLAQGEYIARMDGDDISALDRIEKQVAFLESNPDYGLVGCSYIQILPNGKEIGRVVVLADSDLLLTLMDYGPGVAHPTWLVRKSIYTQLDGYRELPGIEDYDFLLRMISAKLKFTNTASYFGLFLRINREGNTVDTIGLQQIKMKHYCDKLFAERQTTGRDSFSASSLQQAVRTNMLSEKICSFSRRCLQKAYAHKDNHRFIRMIVYCLMALVWPTSVVYYCHGIKRHLIITRHRRK